MVAVWTERNLSFSPAGTGWQNYDIYTNLSVPKGAIASIMIQYIGTSTTQDVGVRTDGSSLSRYIRTHAYAQASAGTYTTMYVKVDSSTGYIETYVSPTSGGVTFYLLGYWTGVDFTEQWTSCMPGSAGAWTDVNLNSVASVPANRVASILLGNKEAAANAMGVRTNGSSLTRYLTIRAGTAGCHRCLTMQVQTDSSGIVEIWSADTTNTSVYCTGYFDNNLFYQEGIQTGSTGSTGFIDWDLTSYLDIDGRVVDFVGAQSRNGAYTYNIGARVNGASYTNYASRYWVGDRTDGTGQSHMSITTGTDASGILEFYTSNASYEFFRFLGYYKSAVTNADITKTSDANLVVGSSTYSVTKNSDARIVKPTIVTKTSDARLKKEFSTTKTSDARFKKTMTVGTPSDWAYYTRIPITYSSDGAQTDYQMKLTIYPGSGTNSAGTIYLNSHAENWPYDIKFENASGDTLPHWRESYDANSQVVWVQTDSIASSGTTDFYLFYGDSGATDESNGGDTFIFFDHFTSIGSHWTQIGGHNATIVDSTWLKLDSTGTTQSKIISTNYAIAAGQNVSIEMYMNIVDINSDAGGGYHSGFYPNLCDASEVAKDGFAWYKEGSYDRYVRINGSGTVQNDGTGLVEGYYIRNTWKYLNDRQIHQTVGTPSIDETHSGTTYKNSNNTYLDLVAGDYRYVNDVRIDWLFMRKLTLNEPTWATPDSESSVASLPTSDAKLIWVRTVTKTSDANLYISGPTTHDITKSSDARLKKLDVTLTKPSDARLKKVDLVLTKPSDARIKKPDNSTTKTSAARLKKLDNSTTKTSDARLKKADITSTKTSDARLKKIDITQTKTSNARLLKIGTTTKASDARLKKLDNTLTKTSSATLEREVIVTKSSDARLKKLDNTLTKSSDARLLKIGSTTKSSDARLKKLDNTLTKTSDAMLSGGSSVGITSNARLKKIDNTLTKYSDARLLKIGTLTKTSSAKLVIYGTLTKLSDARLKKNDNVLTKSSDARLKKADNSTTKSSDARLKKADISFSTYSNAQLKKLGINVTKTSDAYITAGMFTGTVTKTADARLKKLDNTLTKSSDARLLKVGVATKTSDARLKYENSRTITSDARLKATSAFTISSDATLFKASSTRVQVIIIGC